MPLDEGALAGWSAFCGYVGYNILRKTWPSAIAQQSFTGALAITKGQVRGFAPFLPTFTPFYPTFALFRSVFARLFEQIGTISSLHGMAYGFSKFFGALVCDRLGEHVPRVFALGLVRDLSASLFRNY